MAKYLVIESRDPFDSNDVAQHYELVAGLARERNDVTLFLVQNGVLPARRTARPAGLTKLVQAGVKVLADDFSLRERGIPADRLVDGLEVAPIDAVVERLGDGCKALWL